MREVYAVPKWYIDELMQLKESANCFESDTLEHGIITAKIRGHINALKYLIDDNSQIMYTSLLNKTRKR